MSRPRPSASLLWRGTAVLTLWVSAAHGQQTAKLTADDPAPWDRFGWSVSLSDATALVGSRGDGGAGESSGSAYIFREVGGAWQQIAKLAAGDGGAGDEFGIAVSIDGDTALLGADHDDDGGSDSGSAYIFREIGGAWQQIAKLTAGDAAALQEFGASTSISGDTAVIGTGRYVGAGAAYIFREAGGVWEQIAKLDGGDGFGCSVSISGSTLIVGSMYDGGAGAAYLYREVGGMWQEVARLAPDDSASWYEFGRPVSFSGDTAAVAAYIADGGAILAAVYVFREVGGVWQQVAKLAAEDAADADYIGLRMVSSGNTVVFGAVADDDVGANSGSAYVFREEGGVWQQVLKLHADDGAAYDYFGSGVSIDDDTVLIGAFSDDDGGAESGSAYVFNVAPPCPADFNGDGSVNTLDVLGFLNAWAAGDPSADFNGDGTVNTLDVLAFLNAWAAGC